MSTRGIFGVRIDGEDKIGYNHSESYPSWLGEHMLKDTATLLADKGLEEFKRLARNLKLVASLDVPTAEEASALREYVDADKGDNWNELLRDLQGDLPGTLTIGYMPDAHGFIEDSLFCEWGYIVNLDEEVFEVYKGFQKQKHTKGRYADIPPQTEHRDAPYYPCALVKTYPLNKLPKRLPKKGVLSDD